MFVLCVMFVNLPRVQSMFGTCPCLSFVSCVSCALVVICVTFVNLQEVQSMFSGYLGNVNEKGMLLLFPAMDVILTLAPAMGAQVLQPALLRLLALVVGGQVRSCLGAGLESWE